MPRSRPPYSPEYRQQMVDLVRGGRTPDSLSREFEPTAQSIWNWVRQAEHDPPLERLVRAGSRGRLPPAPRVVATGGDPQRATHALHGELGPVVAHELERPRGVEPVS